MRSLSINFQRLRLFLCLFLFLYLFTANILKAERSYPEVYFRDLGTDYVNTIFLIVDSDSENILPDFIIALPKEEKDCKQSIDKLICNNIKFINYFTGENGFIEKLEKKSTDKNFTLYFSNDIKKSAVDVSSYNFSLNKNNVPSNILDILNKNYISLGAYSFSLPGGGYLIYEGTPYHHFLPPTCEPARESTVYISADNKTIWRKTFIHIFYRTPYFDESYFTEEELNNYMPCPEGKNLFTLSDSRPVFLPDGSLIISTSEGGISRFWPQEIEDLYLPENNNISIIDTKDVINFKKSLFESRDRFLGKKINTKYGIEEYYAMLMIQYFFFPHLLIQ